MANVKKTKIELAMMDSQVFIAVDGGDFDQLMKEVEPFVFSDLTNYDEALENLKIGVSRAIQSYCAERYTVIDVSRRNLHELREPLSRVIKILEHEPNRIDLFFALEGDPNKPHVLDIYQASAGYETLLNALVKIRNVVPQPPKRMRQRPTRTDLRAFVERLANEWRIATGKPFTRNWDKGEPITPAMRFVHAVVKFTDPKSLGSVSKMTEKVVKDKRHMRSGKSYPWFE